MAFYFQVLCAPNPRKKSGEAHSLLLPRVPRTVVTPALHNLMNINERLLGADFDLAVIVSSARFT